MASTTNNNNTNNNNNNNNNRNTTRNATTLLTLLLLLLLLLLLIILMLLLLLLLLVLLLLLLLMSLPHNYQYITATLTLRLPETVTSAAFAVSFSFLAVTNTAVNTMNAASTVDTTWASTRAHYGHLLYLIYICW